jgi:hypothetical protein
MKKRADHTEGRPPVVRPFLNRSGSFAVTDVDHERSNSVRAFIMTGGRAVADNPLDFQAMLSTVPASLPLAEKLTFERAKVVEVCRLEPLSVAEVAVRIGVPIGVIQILAADLLREGFLQAHMTDHQINADIALLERLAHGIRAL